MRARHRGYHLLWGQLAWASTVPGGPGYGGSSGTRWLHCQHLPVLSDGGSGQRGGSRHSSLSPASGSERAQRPKPHSGCSERLSGDALWPRGSAGGRMRGPDGGAGAGRVLAPREMPSRARYRLYLRSRLTSAARVPRARAAPGDLARPLHPDSLIPLRYNTAPGPPHVDCSLRSLGQLGEVRGGWAGISYTPAGD